MTQLSMSKRNLLDDLRLSTLVLERGEDRIVSFDGTSQFTAQGVSACGLAAFNFARVAFRIEQNRRSLADVLDELSTKEIIEEIVAICAGWSSNMHLEVDEIHGLPVFSRCLKLTSIEYGRPHPRHFQGLLEIMKNNDKSTVMVITRPPEIIACYKMTKSDADSHSSAPNNPVFVVFDSHPRPSHPQGAGLLFSTSMEATARTLSDILPPMDESMINSPDLQWQAQLLSNCSAHIFVARHRRKDHEAAMVRSSLAILDLRAQISELRRENRKLDSDKKELKSEADRLRVSIQQEKAKAKQEASTSLTQFATRTIGRSFGLISHAVAGPSRTSSTHTRPIDALSTIPVKGAFLPPTTSSTTGAKSIFADNPPPVPSQAPPSYEELDLEDSLDPDTDDPWIQSTRLALQLQDEFDSEERQLRHEHARLVRQTRKQFDVEDGWSHPEQPRFGRQLQNLLDTEDRQLHREQPHFARQLQNPLDAEDRQLRQEQSRLARQLQKQFDDEDRQLRQEQPHFARQLQNRLDAEDRQLRQEQPHFARQLQNPLDAEDRQLRQEQPHFARQLQNQLDAEDRQLRQEQPHLARQLQKQFDDEDRQLRQEQSHLARQLQKQFDVEDRQLRREQPRFACQLQKQFDAEDRQLRQEQKELALLVQSTFQCSICIDELPEDYVAKIEGCMHMLCRSCLREFVSSKIQEHRYPIFCPVCTTETDKNAEPSVISRALIEQLGVSEDQCQILTEMELAEFTIQIHCRKCRRPAFVDREDYAEVPNIVCPQRDCHHVWCKKCEQTIVVDGPKHSCDGSSELEHLMKERGWKHCPNCTTPILKETGCHHMTCISPGCNTHFCYVCGQMIVRSALSGQISSAVSDHYRKCQLFDVPN